MTDKNREKYKKELYAMVVECDGAEIPEGDWPLAEELVAEGLITLGGARGPDGSWKRAELI
ncbi:hypothetical protein LCGC14_3010730 [marine sediment metagenome]|uniref:Uncharacterized protein n=1 Tax=marine sediment metagenome TaxID=412755 RepID=A0A0F8Z5X6_9ZZZZ